jgi:hypothetical protein
MIIDRQQIAENEGARKRVAPRSKRAHYEITTEGIAWRCRPGLRKTSSCATNYKITNSPLETPYLPMKGIDAVKNTDRCHILCASPCFFAGNDIAQ